MGRLRKFRIIVAEKLLRNNSYLQSLIPDIHTHIHIEELCDAYAMQALITWLCTKCDARTYKVALEKSASGSGSDAETFFPYGNIYPFNISDTDFSSADLNESAHHWLDQHFAPDLELIGTLYENLHAYSLSFLKNGELYISCASTSKYDRRKTGQFYTPPWVVDYSFERCFTSTEENLSGFINRIKGAQKDEIRSDFSLLDPACGSGNFLLGALRFMHKIGLEPEAIARFASNGLFGVDSDGRAVCLARHVVAIAIESLLSDRMKGNSKRLGQLKTVVNSLSHNLAVTDSIYSGTPREGYSDSDLRSKLKNSNFSSDDVHSIRTMPEQFDLVITNPPYISFGSRNQDKLAAETASYLKRKFQSAEYKIRFSSVFQELALQKTKPGGKTCLFIPDGFLQGKQYFKLRKEILRKANIESLTELPADAMQGAVVGKWCVAVYERKAEDRSTKEVAESERSGDSVVAHDLEFDKGRQVDLIRIETNATASSSKKEIAASQSVAKEENSHRITLHRSRQGNLVQGERFRFRLLFSKTDEEIAIKLERLPVLRTMLRGHTGIRARNGQSSIISAEKGKAHHRRGIRSGGALQPFKVDWDGSWLEVEPKLLFGGGFDPAVVENPKIMVRQTGDRIIAAFDDSGLYHLNNVHSFSSTHVRPQRIEPKEDAEQTGEDWLHMMTALMNSNLWLYVYRLRAREEGRAMAQIDIDTVEELPLPRYDSELSASIAKLSRMLSSQQASKDGNGERSRMLLSAIDRLVYCSYELESREIEHIERATGVREERDSQSHDMKGRRLFDREEALQLSRTTSMTTPTPTK